MNTEEVLQTLITIETTKMETLTKSHITECQLEALLTADLYLELLSAPEFKEGSLAIKYDKNQLEKLAIAIYKKYEDPKLIDLESDNAIESVNLW